MEDYSKMTDEDFDRLLVEHVSGCCAGTLLQIPGIYAILSEHFNNDVLDAWTKEKELED